MMSVTVREYTDDDMDSMIAIWNEVIEEGIAFPQEEFLNRQTAPGFFAGQSYCGVAADDSGRILGLYILHPNNVGRCGHIGNASYAVSFCSLMRLWLQTLTPAICMKESVFILWAQFPAASG